MPRGVSILRCVAMPSPGLSQGERGHAPPNKRPASGVEAGLILLRVVYTVGRLRRMIV